jgi:hypothetical protein
MKSGDIIACRKCDCGCNGIIYLKKWHFEKHSVIPRFIVGHNPATKFTVGNKIGWKEGKTKCNGYWLIYNPEHPFANKMGKGYIRQNRFLMEQKIGRYLTKNEVVHHINGIRDDDRIENLVLLNHREHISLHSKETVKRRMRNKTGRFT